jgi:hypothetical protein
MIKVTIGESKPQEKPFPKLMINDNGCIRLVFEDLSSLILVSVEGNDFYYNHINDYDLSTFTDYNEPITIQNA